MARMILFCAACSTQNFVSEERRKAEASLPRCWKCGEALPLPGETDPPPRESNKRTGKENRSRSG